MFEESGKKVRALAVIWFILQALGALVGGIMLMCEDDDFIFLGLLLIVLGVFIAYVTTLVLYAIGEAASESANAGYYSREALKKIEKFLAEKAPEGIQTAPQQKPVREAKISDKDAKLLDTILSDE